MSTRGAIGIRSNGKDFIGYNHFDSYPSGLGLTVLADCRKLAKLAPATIRRKLAKLKLVTSAMVPSIDDQKALAKWTDLEVSGRSKQDWYCLTRKAQGSILETFRCGYVVGNAQFLADSLFCEWAYIVNFDDRTLEVYKGFNPSPRAKGRYAALQRERGGEYYGVALVKTYPLDNLPTDDKFLKDNKE